jgi:hypothetical protein
MRPLGLRQGLDPERPVDHRLRAELTQSLGVAWEEPVRGIAEMRDVPEDVRSEFSSRTRAVAVSAWTSPPVCRRTGTISSMSSR